jgi:NAD-dependent dihydropyrimidine dehydrogenase PreA subunit
MNIEYKSNTVYAFPNRPPNFRPVIIDPDICTGCYECVQSCQADVLLINTVKGKPPIIMYPDECYYCGCCVSDGPVPGAIKFNVPMTGRVRFKNKTTGEDYRVK